MKQLFACILILIALYLVLNQVGAIDKIKDEVDTGKSGATLRGIYGR